MKVIGGPESPVFPMKVRCSHHVDGYGFSYGRPADFCGHELEVEESDIKKHPWYKYPEMGGTDYGVVCPVCHMFVVIEEEKLPGYVKEAADRISVRQGRCDGTA